MWFLLAFCVYFVWYILNHSRHDLEGSANKKKVLVVALDRKKWAKSSGFAWHQAKVPRNFWLLSFYIIEDLLSLKVKQNLIIWSNVRWASCFFFSLSCCMHVNSRFFWKVLINVEGIRIFWQHTASSSRIISALFGGCSIWLCARYLPLPPWYAWNAISSWLLSKEPLK